MKPLKIVCLLILILIGSQSLAQWQNNGTSTTLKDPTQLLGVGATPSADKMIIKSTGQAGLNIQFPGTMTTVPWLKATTSEGLNILLAYKSKIIPIYTMDLGDAQYQFRYGFFTRLTLGTVNISTSTSKISADSLTFKRAIVTDTLQGIVILTRSGTRYRIQVSNTGVIKAIAVP